VDPKISKILEQIDALEVDLQKALHERDTDLLYKINGKRIAFEEMVSNEHRKNRITILKWITMNRLQNLLTAPLIYSLIVPFVFLDVSISLYQSICFPIYRIAKTRRADYLIFDHQYLQYLNIIERFHCAYCAYANGVIAHALEVASRTEQYFCPIKHAHKILGRQSRYQYYLEYGDAKDYHAKLEALRVSLGKKDES
jgi:hypothetical protein